MTEVIEDDEANLGDLAARLDAERFVGRRAEIARIEASFRGTSPIRIFYVFGPAGVGKSGLLRELARRGERSSRPVVRIDGRVGPVSGEHLERQLLAVAELDAPVLLIDEADALVPLRFELRDLFLRALPGTVVVVLAGRRPPEREWFEEGIEHISERLELRPLDPEASRDLLRRYGVPEDLDVTGLLRWSQGYPLPLTLAARVSDAGSRLVPSGGNPDWGTATDERVVADLLLDRLAGRELDGIDVSVLEVAAVAPAVDARMLAAVLPGRPTRQALAQLRELSVSERIGHRVTLHRLVRESVRERLKSEEPERYRTLVLRIAEHIAARSVLEPQSAYEITDLIEDPEARVGSVPSLTHYWDRLRPGDADLAGSTLGVSDTAWFGRFRRWCDEMPESIVPVRRVTGELTALVISGHLTDVPAWAQDSIEFGPVLDYAKRNDMFDTGHFVNDVLIVEEGLDAAGVAEVYRVGNQGLLARFADPYMRYVIATGEVRSGEDGTKPFGYVDIDELDRRDDERSLMSWGVDFGPGGAIRRIMEMIGREQGADVPSPGAEAERSSALLVALRSFHDDDVLQQSALGSTVEDVRAVVVGRVETAFGPSDDDAMLKTLLERTYLDPTGGHSAARNEAHMSRSSYFRHLQRARERFADDG